MDEKMILYGYRGSIAHGTHVPPDQPESTDDRDTMGVVIHPLNCYLGAYHPKDTREQFEGDNDIVIYDIKKFVGLLVKGNPNVISMLWNRDDMYLTIDPLGQILIDNRELFLSKRVVSAFHGYATSQLYKMEHLTGQGYMGAKRKEVYNRYGFDTKNAAHLIRLLRMCKEFLISGVFNVYRKDAKDLIAIKQGKRRLDSIIAESTELKNDLKTLEAKSDLPDICDKIKVDSVLMQIMLRHFRGELKP